MVGELDDPRRHEPKGELAERRMLEEWLEYHRTMLLLKCEGRSNKERKRQVARSSSARPAGGSLLGVSWTRPAMAATSASRFDGSMCT